MKTLFIPAKLKLKIGKAETNKIKQLLKELPNKIAVAYSIQFKDCADKIAQILSKDHQIFKKFQVLGCSQLKLSKEVQAVLLLSSSRFHALSLANQLDQPVYLLEDLESGKLTKFSKESQELKNFEKKQKATYLKILNADKVGILISIKPGQQRLKEALALKSKIKNKTLYYFIVNEIQVAEFENFGLDSWVNSACPRLDMDNSRIINMSKM